MKKAEIKAGRTYRMNHSSGLIDVRIVSEKPTRMFGSRDGSNKLMTHWRAVNLKTGRDIEIKSAAKLLCEVISDEEVAKRVARAGVLGKSWQEIGGKGAPGQDTRFMELIEGLGKKWADPIILAWRQGWREAASAPASV